MTTVALAASLLLLTALSILQLAVAAGAPYGRFTWGGQHDVLPRRLRIASALSPLVYALIAIVVLDRAGSVDVLPDGFSTPTAWVVTGYFALGIVMNAISRSKPERHTMTPTCVVLTACSAVIALS